MKDRPWVRGPKDFKPTPQQLKFATVYLETGNIEESYKIAGYYDLSDTTSESRRKIVMERVLFSKGVQKLLKSAREQVIEERRLGLDKLVEGLMLAHSHAKNTREEIMALREIAKLLGYYDQAKVREINKRVADRPLEELSQYELELLLKAEKLDDSEVSVTPTLGLVPYITPVEQQVLDDEQEHQYQLVEMH